MPAARRFSTPLLAALDEAKIIGLRAGTEHKWVGVWVVVAAGRAFVRSWNDKPTGWRQAFLEEPRGAIRLPSEREVRVRARPARSERVLAAVDRAYAEKYKTPASRKWVRGFERGKRRLSTMELVPR